ncbi:hypothetical protein [Embleya sp. NPDC050493]
MFDSVRFGFSGGYYVVVLVAGTLGCWSAVADRWSAVVGRRSTIRSTDRG